MILGILLSGLAYLLGSLCSAVLVARIFNLPDPRLSGSGNVGATNILRIGGKWPAALTLLGDLGKGVLPVVLAKGLGLNLFGVMLVGAVAVLGHIFPLFFHFRGGKGVATLFGVYLAVSPTLALFMAAVWLAIVIIYRYASLASLMAAALGVVGVFLFYTAGLLPALLMTGLVFYRHRNNLQRLRLGAESKLELFNF